MNTYNFVDGNAVAGPLSEIFAVNLTNAQGQCANCGMRNVLANTHVYVAGPGFVARCVTCEHVLMRIVNLDDRLFFEMRGLTHLCITTNPAAHA